MPTKELLENGGPMEGFQLWVNLPSSKKMIPPRYQVLFFFFFFFFLFLKIFK